MDLRWDDVRVFLALMRERTLSGAGARLRADASTMSRRLAAFEESIGRPLFERTRDGLVPTPAALELIGPAEAMERTARHFEEQAEALDGAVEGVVRITAPPMVGETFVVPQLPLLLARHPRLRVEIDASQRRLDLVRGEADLALRDAATASGDVVVTRLFTMPHRLFASRALAARIGVVERLDALPWITWGAPVDHLPAASWLRSAVPDAEPVLRSSSLSAQIVAAEMGLGVVLAPRFIERTSELVVLPLADPSLAAGWPIEALWIAAARTRRTIPRIDAVWSLLVERAAELASDLA